MRMSPRTKYGLDLIARSQRRTLASIAEWLCIKGMKAQQVVSHRGDKCTVDNLLEKLWDPLDADRVVKPAGHDPSLLDYYESLMWKVIDEAPSFWKPTNKSGDKKLAAAVEAKDGRPIRPPRVPNMKRIRERWSTILYANYNADRSAEVALEAKRNVEFKVAFRTNS